MLKNRCKTQLKRNSAIKYLNSYLLNSQANNKSNKDNIIENQPKIYTPKVVFKIKEVTNIGGRVKIKAESKKEIRSSS